MESKISRKLKGLIEGEIVNESENLASLYFIPWYY